MQPDTRDQYQLSNLFLALWHCTLCQHAGPMDNLLEKWRKGKETNLCHRNGRRHAEKRENSGCPSVAVCSAATRLEEKRGCVCIPMCSSFVIPYLCLVHFIFINSDLSTYSSFFTNFLSDKLDLIIEIKEKREKEIRLVGMLREPDAKVARMTSHLKGRVKNAGPEFRSLIKDISYTFNLITIALQVLTF